MNTCSLAPRGTRLAGAVLVAWAFFGAATAAPLLITPDDNIAFVIDAGSIRSYENNKSAWSWVFFYPKEQIGSNKLAVIAFRDEYDCVRRRDRHIAQIQYTSKDVVVAADNSTFPWGSHQPHSNGEAIIALVCDGQEDEGFIRAKVEDVWELYEMFVRRPR